MTDPIRPTDEELTGRIQRSMDHYRLEAPLPSTVLVRARPAWRAGTLLAAGLAGALLTLAVLGATDRLGTASGATPSPRVTPSPAQTADARRSPAPSLAPSDAPVPVAEATERCLRPEGEVPREWLRDGESEADAWSRIALLPLLIEDRQSVGSLFSFGDDRFVVVCTFLGPDEPDVTIIRMLRPTSSGQIIELGGSAAAGGATTAEGYPDPENPPDLLIVGFADASVERVDVVLEDGSVARAGLRDGVWVAWWHRDAGSVAIRGYDRDGSLLDEMPFTVAVPRPIPPGGLEVPAEETSPAPSS
jgi:hypothetical protein